MLNGNEAMGETGGELRLASGLSEEGEILIAVSDSGPGCRVIRLSVSSIRSSRRSRTAAAWAFQSAGGSSSGMGAACGLAVNPGRGATFRFKLPIA